MKNPWLSQNHLYSQDPIHIRFIHHQSQASKSFPLEVLHARVEALSQEWLDNVSSTMQSARQHLNLMFCYHTFTPTPTHTWSAFLPATVFFPVSDEQMSWRSYSNTQGEKISVDGGWVSDAGCALTKKFLCNCGALYWQWSPATVVITDSFFNCRINKLIKCF